MPINVLQNVDLEVAANFVYWLLLSKGNFYNETSHRFHQILPNLGLILGLVLGLILGLVLGRVQPHTGHVHLRLIPSYFLS